MPKQPNSFDKKSLFITLFLVLCLCSLLCLDIFREIPKQEEILIADAQNTEQIVKPTPTPSLPPEAPTPSPTPTPTPEQTITPSPTPKNTPTPVPEQHTDPYPELYANNANQVFAPLEEKTIYLTFDDGPSTSTPELLDVLKDEGVPATFFVAGKSNYKKEILKRIHTEGHTIGVHTLSHDYPDIYRNTQAYLADFSRQYYEIWDATGYRPQVFRFPGGSVNSFNKHNYRELIQEMNARGFVYFDWNVSSGDAAGIDDIWAQLAQLEEQSQNKQRIISLMHDTARNPHTAYVAQLYIRKMKELGYCFKALDTTVAPIQFKYE